MIWANITGETFFFNIYQHQHLIKRKSMLIY